MIINSSEKEKREMIVSQIDKNMFIEAGAGAGKTTLIKDRIVNQLKSGIRPDEIVAITFTNAATGELRKRIIEAAIDESKRTDLTDKEKENIERAINTIDQMQLSTIHSFCNRILKERSLDAGLPMDINLIEEEDLERLKNDSFTRWAEGLKQSDWDELIVAGKYRSSAITMLRNLTGQLIKVADDIKISTGLPPVDKNTFEREAKVFVDSFAGEVLDRANDVYAKAGYGGNNFLSLDEIPDECFNAHGKKVRNAVVNGDLFETLKLLLTPQTTKDFVLIPHTKAFIKEKLNHLKGKKKTERADEIYNEEKEILSGIKKLLDDNLSSLNKLLGGYENYIYMPYVRLAEKSRDYFYENLGADVLTNDLLIRKTYALLTGSEDTRRYYGSRFKCIYVDEYQDTDHIQAEFIRMLAEKPGQEGALRDGALFVVGDPKQSIYRFRGAEPEVYFDTKESFESLDNAYVIELQDNYRSNDSIINWVNDSFQNKDITPDHAYVPMQVTKALKQDMISDKTIYGIYYNNSLKDDQGAEELDKDIAGVTDFILNLVNGGYEIIDHNKDIPYSRRIKYSDFLVLCRNTTDMDIYIEYMKDHGIPIAVDSKIKVEGLHYLKALYRLFIYLTNPYDRTYMTAAREGLIALGYSYESAAGLTEELKTKTEGMTAVSILSFLEQNPDLFLYIDKEMDKDSINNIRARMIQMAAKVLSVSDCSRNGLRRALEDYLKGEIEHELPLVEGTDAVRFMNLHKAKGLEGNIVIWANRQEKEQYSNEPLLLDREFYPTVGYGRNPSWYGYNRCKNLMDTARRNMEAEKTRLEYVAVTRAKQAFIFMDRYQSAPVLFGEGYDAGNRSINHIINEKENPLRKLSASESDTAVISLLPADAETLKKPLYRSESPSKLEDEEAGKEGKSVKSEKSTDRPRGAVYGTVMHRSLELLVGRLMTTGGNDDLYSNIKATDLLKGCYIQAINENIENISTDELQLYRDFSMEVAMAFGKWWVSNKMGDNIEEYYTELPFSYFRKDGDELVWNNGFADLLLKLKSGEYLIIDYKSDNDEEYSDEEAFVKRLKGKYSGQIASYKEALAKIFRFPEDKIKGEIISFSRKYLTKDETLRVRVTEIG